MFSWAHLTQSIEQTYYFQMQPFNLKHLLFNEHGSHHAFLENAKCMLIDLGTIEKSSLIFGKKRQVQAKPPVAHNTTTPLGVLLRELPENKKQTKVDFQCPNLNRNLIVSHLQKISQIDSFWQSLWMVIGLLYTSSPLRECVRLGTETGVYKAFFDTFDERMTQNIHGVFTEPKIPNDPKSTELIGGCLSPIEICIDLLRHFETILLLPSTANPML